MLISDHCDWCWLAFIARLRLINRIESWRRTPFLCFEWTAHASQSGDTSSASALEIQQNKAFVFGQINGVGKFQMIDHPVHWVVTTGCFATRCVLIGYVVVQTGEILLRSHMHNE